MAVTSPDRLRPADVADIICAQFPNLRAEVVTYLGEGDDSTAFDVDGRWVFRFPKRAEVESQLLLEMRLLPVLAASSPLPLPAFSFHGQPAPGFPRHFGGYAKLPGVAANTVDPAAVRFAAWAPVIGTFLSWVHAYPVDDAKAFGVPSQDAEIFDEMRSDALDAFDNVSRVAPSAPHDIWHRFIAEAPGVTSLHSMPPALVHADFAAEHVLCDMDAGIITGIIDWTDVCIGDPAIDLLGLYHWGGTELVDLVLPAYRHAVDEATLTRARYFAACRGVGDVRFGLEMGRPEYVNGGIRALTMCAA